MKSYTLKTQFGSYEVLPYEMRYVVNNAIAVQLMDADDFAPFAMLTVNLPDDEDTRELCGDNAQFVDTNNCPWAIEFLEENEIAKPTGFCGFSGFCVYPLYQFDTNKLNIVKVAE